MVKPGRVPDQLVPVQAAAPAPMQPKVGTLDKKLRILHRGGLLGQGYARTTDGTTRREETYRDERHSRTETRPVRAAPAFPVDSLTLARTSKRPKYSPSLDDARYGGDEDAESTVSMSTVSSLAMEPPLTID